MKAYEDKIGKILWSIALPGFGQILNGQIFKGIIFIALELLVNFMAKINIAIMLSFQGDIQSATEQTDYQWLMFYPCVYMFSIYDAYINAKGRNPEFSYLPFVFSAIIGTLGVIYSNTLRVFNVVPGPIFLPLICFIVGSLIGNFLRLTLIRFHQ